MQDWYADDNFWNDLYAHIFNDAKEDVAEEQIQQVMALTGIRGGAALDMPCGPGRHVVPLARAGFAVTGIDLNERLLERAATRCEEEGITAELIAADMRTFCRDESFDLAVSMFNSLGYFDSKKEDVQILTNMRRSLRSDGAVLLELVSKEYLTRTFEPERISRAQDGSKLVQRLTLLAGGSRIRNCWTLHTDGTEREFCFEQTIFAGVEMEALLREAGFEQIALYGNLDGVPYDEEATRLIAIGRRE